MLGEGVVSEKWVDGWMDGILVRMLELDRFLGVARTCESWLMVASDFLFSLLKLELNYDNMRMDDRHKMGINYFFSNSHPLAPLFLATAPVS